MKTRAIFEQELVVETRAELNWTAKIVDPVFHDGQIDADLLFVADFPHCASKMAQRGIVLDIQALIDSVIRPGSHFILNCTCGIAKHAGLGAPVRVAHPDDEHIIWELGVEALRPALADDLQGPGFIRLVFDRTAYRQSVLDLLACLREMAGSRQPLSAYDSSALEGATGPNLPDTLIVDGIQPAWRNSDELTDELVDAIGTIDWRPRPIVPSGSEIEIGLFDSEAPCRIDGRPGRDWIGAWFTRHAVARAWDEWPIIRRYATDDGMAGAREFVEVSNDKRRNHLIMKPGTTTQEFDRLGERFARLLGESLAEGSTAPGARVVYRKTA